MKEILQTRIFHWKKQWITVLFWFLLPIMSTIVIVFLIDTIKDETKIPVGIVVSEHTNAANDLLKSIEQSPLIQPITLPKEEAMYRLTKHELDSVFIIQNGYEDKIRKHDRHHLVTSYHTQLSFAYPTVKEIIISHVQQETGRSKAAQVVKSLAKQSDHDGRWTWEEIVATSKTIQVEQDLLHTSFTFEQQQSNQLDDTVFNLWNIWALSALLSTLLLFDWPSKEAHSKLRTRFAFIKMPMKQYLLLNVLVYLTLFITIDLLTIITFHYLFDEQMTLSQFGTVITYRMMICLGSFLLSLCFKRVYSYYLFSFVLCLLMAIGSGVIIPLDGLVNHAQIIKWINPLDSFVSNNFTIYWLIMFLLIITFWYVKKERYDVTS